MSSLVEELQRDALDCRVRVSDLLRKAKAIAVKLDLPELEKWVEAELNGYPPAEVPDYRVVYGKVKYLNMYYGWYPITFQDTKTEQAFSKRNLYQRVAELEELPELAGGRELHFALSNEAKEHLMRATGCEDEITVAIPSMAVVGILDAVRNAVHDWSLKLEKAGVMVEGMSFSNKEREKAHEVRAVYNIGTIETFTGNIGSGSGNFSVEGNTVNVTSKAAIESLVRRIRDSEVQLGLKPESAQELHQTLDDLQTEIKAPQPSAKRIKSFLASLRDVAEKAAGSLAAQGILYELDKLMHFTTHQ